MSAADLTRIELTPALFAGIAPVVLAVLQLVFSHVPMFKWEDLSRLLEKDTRQHFRVFGPRSSASNDLHRYIEFYNNGNAILIVSTTTGVAALLFNLSCTGSLFSITVVTLVALAAVALLAGSFVVALWRERIDVPRGQAGRGYLWGAVLLAFLIALADVGRQMWPPMCWPHTP